MKTERPIKLSSLTIKILALLFICFSHSASELKSQSATNWSLNQNKYLENNTSSILVFSDLYSEGHQGGIQIIHHANRIAANGDIRLEPAPGQWQPFSQFNDRKADSVSNSISVSLSFPNEKAATRKFNRIEYPDLELNYRIEVLPEGESVRLLVHLDKKLPKKWIGKVGFNLELFPGTLFGKHFIMDEQPGRFSTQINGPYSFDHNTDTFEVVPIASGKQLTIAPDDPLQTLSIFSGNTDLQLIDGRSHHSNGWFIVRSLIPEGASEKALEWIITPKPIADWKYDPVIHINQAGYLPAQPKRALIECDKSYSKDPEIKLLKIDARGNVKQISGGKLSEWGTYQRYKYFNFDFSNIHEEGIYQIWFDSIASNSFIISRDNYARGIWQPTLEYFLPVQMCHMRVNDRYRVWHGLCHKDDAKMAPIDIVHFDGYYSEGSTLTNFAPLEHVPGLNIGGWHDAGDYDLRIESQGGTIYSLSLINDLFQPEYDITTIDQQNNVVELHVPDNLPDIKQQIEHGALGIVSGYRSLGRLYRGIICNNLRQYVLLGDASVMTDNLIYTGEKSQSSWMGNSNDDRWVFTEINPRRELQLTAYLAAASRSLKGFNDSLAAQCLNIAEELWLKNTDEEHDNEKIIALTELILTTGKQSYTDALTALEEQVLQSISETGWAVARVLDRIDAMRFQRGYTMAIQTYYRNLNEEVMNNPFRIPYQPRVWGAAWGVEQFGVQQYYLYKHLQVPEAKEYFLNSLDYVLGIHPGKTVTSFVSGVGTQSATVAYGVNRADWSYIPGGVISGTATIQPDFPELKIWPYFWQQTEYMVSGAASRFMFLVLGAIEVLEE